jgi:hypothetical protein
MAYDYLGLTNEVIARMNEVPLTSSNFLAARGFQIQCQNAVNDSINYINQREFGWSFTHRTQTQNLIPGTTRYTVPANTQSVDYDSFRISKNQNLSSSGITLRIIDYKEYTQRYISQENDVTSTTLNGAINATVTTITVVSTTGFDSVGTIQIENETITYTGITATTFTGCTRGADGSTADAHADTTSLAQFTSGGIPNMIFRTPDNNFGLYPYPDKAYELVYEYFDKPTALVNATDVPTIPEQFRQVIVDGATAYSYQYRGEAQQYGLNFARFEEGIKQMQTLLLNRADYVRSTYIPYLQRYGNSAIF